MSFPSCPRRYVLLFFLLRCAGANAQPLQTASGLTYHAVSTIDPADPDLADLAFLKQQIGAARVVFLGELTHGEGNVFEAKTRLVRYLQQQGLHCIDRNYRCRFGEIDLIFQDARDQNSVDKTLVFVEVRLHKNAHFGGAAASIGSVKRRSLVFAAQRFLQYQPSPPPCRFDVLVFDGDEVLWLKAAFDAGESPR